MDRIIKIEENQIRFISDQSMQGFESDPFVRRQSVCKLYQIRHNSICEFGEANLHWVNAYFKFDENGLIALFDAKASIYFLGLLCACVANEN